ncbi:MAG: alpha/beta fold hydrolase [Gemmatimonadota bacterium]|nr:MAG: alpha/beta fold hydrolase [Gemmatimonadota bacterium]
MSEDISKQPATLSNLTLVVTLTSALATGQLTAPASAVAQQRESIFDSVVHIEAATITRIPDTPRLEQQLGIEGRRISVGDAELWVEVEGSGTPIVLINGGPGGTHHQFHPWFERAAEFAQVIYYDQRGCGLSDYQPGPDGYSIEQAVGDLEALRQALGLQKIVLAGFSYGGFLAQFYTTQYPDNVAGLVLVGAAAQISANTGGSRQGEFITDEERAQMRRARDQLREMAPDSSWTPAELLALIVYNNHVNGDWKRQHYYKPSPESMAHIALYEWVQDRNFNGIMNQSKSRVDLTGAFDSNPIPTLIMEGEWDLTWGPEKKHALAANHPNGRLVTFERAGHSIHNEDTDGFFTTLRDFVEGLAPVDAADLAQFRASLQLWQDKWMASPTYNLRAIDWGHTASVEIAAAFQPSWVEDTKTSRDYLRLGFALYDVRRYAEARSVFARLREESQREGPAEWVGLATIWEAHMLDLLRRRSEAVALYQEVANMDLDFRWTHGQYGMRYQLSPYATERLETPFERIENREQ